MTQTLYTHSKSLSTESIISHRIWRLWCQDWNISKISLTALTFCRYSWSPKEKKEDPADFGEPSDFSVPAWGSHLVLNYMSYQRLKRFSLNLEIEMDWHLRLQATFDHTLFSCCKHFIYLTSRDDLDSPVNLMCMFLFCGRKPDQPHERQRKNMQTQHRTAWARGSNQDPSFCEVTVVTTMLAVGW